VASAPTQLAFDDLLDGCARRDAGVAAAGLGTPAALDSVWRQAARDVVHNLAATGAEFSAVDVRYRAGDPPVPNMLGAAFLAARKARLIVRVGFTTNPIPSAHARTIATYRGAT